MESLQQYKNTFVMPPQGYVYDALVKGFDSSFWATVAGSPSFVSPSVLINAATIATYVQPNLGIFTFNLKIPTIPTSGDVRSWGIKNPSTDDEILFVIEDDALIARVTGQTDVVLDSDIISTDAQDFQITWNPESIGFSIDGVGVAAFETILNVPMSVYIDNQNADDIEMQSVSLLECGRIN